MSHTLAVFHVLSAGIALLLASAIVVSRPGRRHQRPRPSGRAARRFVATCWPLLGRLVWVVLLLVGRPVANRRYGLVEPVLRPFEEHLAAHNHRLPLPRACPSPPPRGGSCAVAPAAPGSACKRCLRAAAPASTCRWLAAPSTGSARVRPGMSAAAIRRCPHRPHRAHAHRPFHERPGLATTEPTEATTFPDDQEGT
jgi:hypothetical protein